MCYVCVQLYAYVTHGNVNVLRLRTAVCICNIWTFSVTLSYDMYEPYSYVYNTCSLHEEEVTIAGTIIVTDLFLIMHVFNGHKVLLTNPTFWHLYM